MTSNEKQMRIFLVTVGLGTFVCIILYFISLEALFYGFLPTLLLILIPVIVYYERKYPTVERPIAYTKLLDSYRNQNVSGAITGGVLFGAPGAIAGSIAPEQAVFRVFYRDGGVENVTVDKGSPDYNVYISYLR